MIFMVAYTIRPEHRDAALARFKETGGLPPPGIKMLARWHSAAGGQGWTISETDDVGAAYAWTLRWSDLLSFEITPVLTDEQMAKAMGAG